MNLHIFIPKGILALPLECAWTGSRLVTSPPLSYSQRRTTKLRRLNLTKLSRIAAVKLLKVSLPVFNTLERVSDVDGLLTADGFGTRCPAEGRRRLTRCGSVAAPQEDATQSRWFQTAGDHNRVPRRGEDQSDGEVHGRHLLRGVQVNCG